MNRKHVNRRDFIRQATVAGIGAAFLGGKGMAQPKQPGWFKKRGTVIRVIHSGALNKDGTANPEIVQVMIDRGLCELTGAKKIEEAWSRFAGPNDVVGLKINTLGLDSIARTRHVSHFHAVTGALANGLVKANVNRNNIVIWDRNLSDLGRANFSGTGSGTVQCRGGREEGVEEKPFKVGGKNAYLYKMLTQRTSALVNVCLAKSHEISGITGALKNHYGSIDNPDDFHENGCTGPGIPELNAIEPVRSKERLIVMDALYSVIEGGPDWSLDFMKKTNAILFSTDPVATDAVLLDAIDKLRREIRMDSLVEKARFLKLSADLGLGERNLSKINLVEIKLG